MRFRPIKPGFFEWADFESVHFGVRNQVRFSSRSSNLCSGRTSLPCDFSSGLFRRPRATKALAGTEPRLAGSRVRPSLAGRSNPIDSRQVRQSPRQDWRFSHSPSARSVVGGSAGRYCAFFSLLRPQDASVTPVRYLHPHRCFSRSPVAQNRSWSDLGPFPAQRVWHPVPAGTG
jgi:hypothetical protein